MPAACDVKEEQHGKASGSIAFTGPVQDVTGTMPGIPGSLPAEKPDVLGKPEEVRTKPARSDADVAADRAAEAEEELRADEPREEQQEPPEEDGPCADPWAEDPWSDLEPETLSERCAPSQLTYTAHPMPSTLLALFCDPLGCSSVMDGPYGKLCLRGPWHHTAVC